MIVLFAIFSLFFVILFHVKTSNHPCGRIGGIIEKTNAHQHFWDALPQSTQWCLIEAGSKRAIPTHGSSYFAALMTIMFEVQSRYITTWQAAQSYQFEKEMEEFIGIERAQYVTTGDNALVTALQSLGVGYGDEVVIPAHARIGTASSVSISGGIPVIANIDETLGINPLTMPITKRTKAIIAVHPCDIEKIVQIAKEKKVHVLEDITEVIGARVSGRKAGKFGLMSIAYMHKSDILHSGGPAGIVMADEDELRLRMEHAIENGMAAWGGKDNLPSYKRSFGSKDPTRVEVFAGHCFRSPSEWQASWARIELKYFPSVMETMVDLKAAFYNSLKPQYQALVQRHLSATYAVPYTISFTLKKEAQAKQLQEYLLQNKVLVPDSNPWQKQYLPNVPSLMNKVSFHSSGFPWVKKEDKKPLKYEDYNVSDAILRRTVHIHLSAYYTKSMMQWAGVKVSAGLDSIIGA